jgi:hypothetical protein
MALPDPADLQKHFESWWRTASSIVGTIATALAALNLPTSIAYFIAAAVTITGIVIAIVFYRRDLASKEKDAAADRAVHDSKATTASAFRGLRRFLRGEFLPGPRRRKVAAQLQLQVTHPDFKIALVTGDSGAGKSSLLECELVDGLEAADHPVVMISNSSRLIASGPLATATTEQIQQLITNLNDQISIRQAEGKKAIVLILDQFEELLSRIQSEDDRGTLGAGIWQIIEKGARIIIGVRKEYLVDFKSIAAKFSYTVSFEDTFLVENFDINEAAEVIRECAKQDQLTPDAELPQLIAQDLAVEGKVRPADLQIVCTALSGDLSTERYLSEGRAAGLRSRFIKGVIDITGDAVLARTVLRQLCDIPNNKKTPEPLSSEDIANKAKAGAPGPRATIQAVTSVLQALQQARVVICTESAEPARWSLIHDYFVEPIKLATEEQTTQGEAAVARLDYFVARAQTTPSTIIPLEELRSIRKNAPPVALANPAASKLVRRSLVVGYGKPVTGAVGITLAAALVVIFAATERQWRVLNEGSHWDAASSSNRSNLSIDIEDNLQGRQNKPAVIVGIDRFDRAAERYTIWDLETGELIRVQTGQLSVANGWIWNFDPSNGRLSRRDAVATEHWSLTTSHEGRPATPLAVEEYTDPYVIFQPDFRAGSHSIVLDIGKNKWRVVSDSEISPRVSETSYSKTATQSTKTLRAIFVERDNSTRITVWTSDFTKLIFDEQISGIRIRLLDLIERDSRTVLSFVKGTVVETISINHSIPEAGQQSPTFTIGDRAQIKIPDGLNISDDDETISREERTVIWRVPNLVLIIERKPTRTIFWTYNSDTSRFGEPIIAGQAVTISQSDMKEGGRAWVAEGASGAINVWLPGEPKPFRLEGMQLRSKDLLYFSKDRSRLLLISEDKSGELWDANRAAGKATLLAKIDNPLKGQFFFSTNGNAILLRQPGGLHLVWDRQGVALGNLGIIGSNVRASSYRTTCHQLLLWTSEGQRLDFRQGFSIPIFGFLPDRRCSKAETWGDALIDGLVRWFAK